LGTRKKCKAEAEAGPRLVEALELPRTRGRLF
jgi:hypothetical protein